MGKVMALKWRSTENCKTISCFTAPAEQSDDCNVVIANFIQKSLIILGYRNGEYMACRDGREMFSEFWW
jgi:hypothetical protein